ncbi:MAG: M56 family metallopeptidase [Pseudonocardia sp.]
MELGALGLLLLGVALAEPVSRALAVAHWPIRDPVGALLVWQAIGLAGGLALLGAGVVYGLAPLGDTPVTAATAGAAAVLDGRFPSGLGVTHVVALLAAAALAARLLGVLAVITARTLRLRRRHRDLVDVLGTPWPAAPGARVLDHPTPVAYCLPGLSSRLVLSAGVLDVLDPAELAAVLAHEGAHLRERHDLVVLPFVAWGATAPFVRGMRCAQLAVAALIEMRADDVAVASVRPAELSGALRAVGGRAPAAALSSFDAALESRHARILAPPPPLPLPLRVLVRVAAPALVAAPTIALLVA